MHTSTQRSTRTRKPAAARLPYPDLPKLPNRLFNLALYLRQVAECEALHTAWLRENEKKRTNEPLIMAMIAAEGDLKREIRVTTVDLAQNGLLPFAFEGTTALEHQAVLQ